jgi:D-sedoheptulose 7-phosphate isomerase
MSNELFNRYPTLLSIKNNLENTTNAIIDCFEKGGKLLICGNGGSCADADHILGELMKGFLKKRPVPYELKQEMQKNNPQIKDDILDKLQMGLPAIALPSFTALNSAFCNDVDPELIYAQALMGLGNKNDILLCISTSGNSKNVFAAAEVGKALGLKIIGLTGANGGKLNEISDICITVPETETFKVQELHLPVYHYLCAEVEKYFFKD